MERGEKLGESLDLSKGPLVVGLVMLHKKKEYEYAAILIRVGIHQKPNLFFPCVLVSFCHVNLVLDFSLVSEFYLCRWIL